MGTFRLTPDLRRRMLRRLEVASEEDLRLDGPFTPEGRERFRALLRTAFAERDAPWLADRLAEDPPFRPDAFDGPEAARVHARALAFQVFAFFVMEASFEAWLEGDEASAGQGG